MKRIRRIRSRSAGRVPGVAADDRQVFRYRVDLGAGEQDVVSLLEPDWVFRHGLHPGAILGVLRDGADLAELAPVDVRENGAFLRLLFRVVLYENIADCGDICREAEIQGTGYGSRPGSAARGVAAPGRREVVAGAHGHARGRCQPPQRGPSAGSGQRGRKGKPPGWFADPSGIVMRLLLAVSGDPEKGLIVVRLR